MDCIKVAAKVLKGARAVNEHTPTCPLGSAFHVFELTKCDSLALRTLAIATITTLTKHDKFLALFTARYGTTLLQQPVSGMIENPHAISLGRNSTSTNFV